MVDLTHAGNEGLKTSRGGYRQALMAARSIWNGTITFGQVRIPVKLFSAIGSKAIRFREVHLEDGTPLEHRRICRAEEVPVDYDEIVKGYEVTPDEFVILDRDEIKAAAADRGKVLDLEEFVDSKQIDPVLFERTYYLGFRDDPAPYSLLEAALRKCGRAGIGRFSLRGREYLVAVRSGEGHLLLHTMKFHDEVVKPAELDMPALPEKSDPRELKMAKALIGSLTEPFQPEAYEDRHRAEVMKVIRAKASGKDLGPAEAPEADAGDDLAAALEASLAKRKARS
jgi:DNA end-binding protein Ku